jgi:hypothetical protein
MGELQLALLDDRTKPDLPQDGSTNAQSFLTTFLGTGQPELPTIGTGTFCASTPQNGTGTFRSDNIGLEVDQ